MPIYVYGCGCGYSREVLTKSHRDTPELDCPHCGSILFRDFMSEKPNFILRGGCWAKQGYDKSDRQMIIDSDKECMEIDKENKGN